LEKIAFAIPATAGVELAIAKTIPGFLPAQLEGDRLHGRRDRFHDRRAPSRFRR